MDLVQVALRATDLDRAERFWSQLLGSAPTGRFEPPGLLFFRVGPTRLLLETGAAVGQVYLGVEDLTGTVDRLRASGVLIEAEPQVIFEHTDDSLGPAGTQEWHAFVRDPDGNLVGLVSRTPAPGAVAGTGGSSGTSGS